MSTLGALQKATHVRTRTLTRKKRVAAARQEARRRLRGEMEADGGQQKKTRSRGNPKRRRTSRRQGRATKDPVRQKGLGKRSPKPKTCRRARTPKLPTTTQEGRG
ncbi:hypothetical protein NDU88_006507 [Pleurodeles waltl]|uniref:Uncharacterized protein n=1 Tax=Pleurodeles waltl TaxID=8319 RepID=A0AAV7X1A6_PLEWA|nr:hypothetical protein NDU88_006507 [Pleurodeles waltl]